MKKPVFWKKKTKKKKKQKKKKNINLSSAEFVQRETEKAESGKDSGSKVKHSKRNDLD